MRAAADHLAFQELFESTRENAHRRLGTHLNVSTLGAQRVSTCRRRISCGKFRNRARLPAIPTVKLGVNHECFYFFAGNVDAAFTASVTRLPFARVIELFSFAVRHTGWTAEDDISITGPAFFVNTRRATGTEGREKVSRAIGEAATFGAEY